MSYLVECVAGPSRLLASRAAPRPVLQNLRHGSARPTLARNPRTTSYNPRRLQSTVAPIVIDSVAGVPETSILDPLANALLASPLPAWATIIALTLCVRTGITLPVSLWQRRRMLREASEVRPRMKQINEKLAVSVMKDCRARGVDYEGYKKELKTKLAVEQAALHKQFGTHPTITMAAPLVVHVPLLITVSLTLRRALELPGSAMASEGFLWINTLGEVDPVGALPIIGALVALTNAESLGRKREQAMIDMAQRPTPPPTVVPPPRPSPVRCQTVGETPATAARYQPPPNSARSRQLSTSRPVHASRPGYSRPRRTLEEVPAAGATERKGLSESEKASVRSTFLTYVLRGMALVFIPFASSVPAALALYWVSSLTYTLGQSLVLNRLDRNALLARRAAIVADRRTALQ